jgi:ABC-type branched-subunit amino acid transport system substrate-binding protein
MYTRNSLFKVFCVLLALVLLIAAVPGTTAQDKKPIVVGSTLSLTGSFAATAIIHKIAGEAFVTQLNENGGLLGRPVEWKLYDDESKPDKVTELYERLVAEDKVDLLIGPYSTANITAAMQVAARNNMVFPHHTASLTYVYTYKWHFPTWSIGLNTHITTNDILFDAIEASGNKPKTIAIVTNQSPGAKNLALGNDVLDAGGAKVMAEKRGWKVVLEAQFPTGTTDFGPIAAQIKQAAPDFLWVGALGVDGNNLIDAMQAIGYTPPGQFYLWPAPGPLLTKGKASEGAFSVTLFEEHPPFTDSKENQKVIELFHAGATKAKLPYINVETQAAASWSAWQTLVAGVKGAGNLDQEAIGNYLVKNGADTIQGHLIFDSKQQNFGPDLTKIKQIQNGTWVVVWPPDFTAPGVKAIYSPDPKK